MKLTNAQRIALEFLDRTEKRSVAPGRQLTGQMIMPATLNALVDRGLARRTDVPFHSAVDRPTYGITSRGRSVLLGG